MSERLLEMRLDLLPEHLPEITISQQPKSQQPKNDLKLSFRFSSETFQIIDALVEKGLYKNRSDFIRIAIDLLMFKICILAELNPEIMLKGGKF